MQFTKLRLSGFKSFVDPTELAIESGVTGVVGPNGCGKSNTGKIKFIFRDFPLDRIALAASMIARCVPEERYFGVINLMFETQDTWRNAANPQAALESIGRLAGMPSETLQVCVQNRAVFDAVMKQRNDGDKKFKIESTPTILVNGQKIKGSLDIGRFREVVDQALADARQ